MAPGRSGALAARRSVTTSRCAAARRRSPSRWRRRRATTRAARRRSSAGLPSWRSPTRSRRGSPAQASRAGNLLGILAAHRRQRVGCERQRPSRRRDVRGGDPGRPGERGREVQPRADPAPDQGGRIARGRGRLVRRLRRVAAGRRRRAAGVGLLMLASVSLLAPYGPARLPARARADRRRRPRVQAAAARVAGARPRARSRTACGSGRRAAGRRVSPARDRDRRSPRSRRRRSAPPAPRRRWSSSPMSRAR